MKSELIFASLNGEKTLRFKCRITSKHFGVTLEFPIPFKNLLFISNRAKRSSPTEQSERIPRSGDVRFPAGSVSTPVAIVPDICRDSLPPPYPPMYARSPRVHVDEEESRDFRSPCPSSAVIDGLRADTHDRRSLGPARRSPWRVTNSANHGSVIDIGERRWASSRYDRLRPGRVAGLHDL